MVACPVRAGNTRAVKHQRYPGLVQGNVHEQLVEATVQERRVKRHHRVHPPVGEPGAHGHRVLLGNAHIDHALGVRLGELAQPHGDEHRPGDTHNVFTLIGDLFNFAPEDAGPRLFGAL